MIAKLCLLVALVSTGFAVHADDLGLVERQLTSTRPFASGFRALTWNCGAALSDRLHALRKQAETSLAVMPGRFNGLSAQRRVDGLHGLVDAWFHLSRLTVDLAFLRSTNGVSRLDHLAKFLKSLNNTPLMLLRPFGGELLVIAVKLEPIVAIADRLSDAQLNILRNFIATAIRFGVESTPTNHALRSRALLNVASLRVSRPRLDRDALTAAAGEVLGAAQEDRTGENSFAYLEVGAMVLQYVLAASTNASGDAGLSLVRENLIFSIADGLKDADGESRSLALVRLRAIYETYGAQFPGSPRDAMRIRKLIE